jgi:hypothetical protein
MPEQDVEVSLAEPKHGEGRRLAVGLIGLLFVLPAKRVYPFMAISGLRLLIGVGALAAAAPSFDQVHSACNEFQKQGASLKRKRLETFFDSCL